VRAKRITLGYADVQKPSSAATAPAAATEEKSDGKSCCGGCAHDQATGATPAISCCGSKGTAEGFLWWCDGPCGPAKAAITAQAKESSLKELDLPADRKHLVAAIKKIAAEVKSNHAAGGILLVQNAAAATVFANRCPSLRAILGTCQDAVEQGIQQVAANVLIVEYPYKTLQQIRNMLGRFVKAKREVSDDLKRQLAELASCG
jgi:ribose 5-phosphate isomerase RpiB